MTTGLQEEIRISRAAVAQRKRLQQAKKEEELERKRQTWKEKVGVCCDERARDGRQHHIPVPIAPTDLLDLWRSQFISPTHHHDIAFSTAGKAQEGQRAASLLQELYRGGEEASTGVRHREWV